jgi:hypothetical protein
MKKDKTADTLSGTLTQVLLSPKGVIEGLLLSIRGKQVQISTAPGAIDEYAHVLVAGVRVVAMAIVDHSLKTKGGSHPVFKVEQLTRIGGKDLRESTHGAGPVVLEGLKKSGLKVGAKVVAKGERRMTALGTTLLEAREINHVKIA